LIFVSKEGVLERGLKERGVNIEITVLHSFLSLPKHAAGEGATAGVKAWISRSMYCMYLVICSNELVNISLPILSC
jgi:hypothetical protein